jgi:hypothetical protein
MMVELGIHSKKTYQQEFESIFLKETALYFKTESNNYISINSCPSFLRKADDRLKEEHERVLNYLD